MTAATSVALCLAGGALAVDSGANDPQSWSALIVAFTGMVVAIYPLWAKERDRRDRRRRR